MNWGMQCDLRPLLPVLPDIPKSERIAPEDYRVFRPRSPLPLKPLASVFHCLGTEDYLTLSARLLWAEERGSREVNGGSELVTTVMEV